MKIDEFKSKVKKQSKWKNKITEYNGRKYQSKREADHAALLDEMKKDGQIVSWIPQVKFPLPGKSDKGKQQHHYIDFLAFLPDGTYRLIESKGFDHATGKFKRNQVEEIYGVSVEVWRK